MADLIVVVPGIGGSILTRDGTPLWDPSVPGFARMLLTSGAAFNALPLSAPARDDGVTAPALIGGVHLIPGLWSYGSYRPLTKRLRRIASADVLEFPYDWRRSNAHTATLLDRAIDRELKIRSDGVSVVLVAHSMGGLVARRYLAMGATADRCRLLVTIGTPYRGAVKALHRLVNGMSGPRKLRRRLTALVRSLPSVYELLPTYDCIVEADKTRTGLTQHHGLVPDAALLEAAAAFHSETNKAFAEKQQAPIDMVAIVGQRQRTNVLATVDNGVVHLVDDDTWTHTKEGRRLVRGGGDGTVPRGSSQPPEWGTSVRGAQPFSGRHINLPQRKSVWNAVEGAITGHEFLHLGAEHDEGFGIGLPDTITSNEPLVVEAAHTSEALRLDLRVTEVDSGRRAAQKRLRSIEAGRYTASVEAIDPGLYEVSVSGHVDGAPRTVSDVVTVFPESH